MADSGIVVDDEHAQGRRAMHGRLLSFTRHVLNIGAGSPAGTAIAQSRGRRKPILASGTYLRRRNGDAPRHPRTTYAAVDASQIAPAILGSLPTFDDAGNQVGYGMHKTSPILVAEDNDDDFSLFRRAVRAGGIENPVLRFRDGSEMVDFLAKLNGRDTRHAEPWLAFIDIGMPIMNGFEVLQRIQEEGSKLNLLPIILTGSSSSEDMKRAFALGAYEYLVKPIAPAVFAALAIRPMRQKESVA
jgi:CheY-like chemotaxis protein